MKLAKRYWIHLNAKSFSNMKNLQIFINCNAFFTGEVEYLPNELRFLDWPNCPLPSLPSNFNPRKLIKLNMPYSNMLQMEHGLKVCDLNLICRIYVKGHINNDFSIFV